ncbi:MAG: hypothetical protein NC177_18385 [Ruminococcus flavefaciens]|nr:hypothetical protein [Ruminococcus flavefaciens]
MTTKEVEAFLKKAYRAKQRMQFCRERIDELEAEKTSISSSGFSERVQSSIQGDRIQRIIEKIEKSQQKYLDELEDLIDIQDQVERMLDLLEDINQRLVLENRYLLNYSWNLIASVMKRSNQWVHELHNRGIKKISTLDYN